MALHKTFIFCSGLNIFRRFGENVPAIARGTDCGNGATAKAQPMQTNLQCLPFLQARISSTDQHSVTRPIESIPIRMGTP